MRDSPLSFREGLGLRTYFFLYFCFMNDQKTGAKFALIIGLPIGLAFCLMALSLSEFYPFAYLLRIASLKIFWNPLIWMIIAATVTVALWQTGKVIAPSLKKRDILQTSFYFTFLVNIKLLLIMAAIYFGGMINDWLFNTREIFLAAIPYSILIMILFFAFATVVLSITVSLAIVHLTKSKLGATASETIALEIEPIEVENRDNSNRI